MAKVELTCAKCGKSWLSTKGNPDYCKHCKTIFWNPNKKFVYKVSSIGVSDEVYESLFRHKVTPDESMASVVDRLLSSGISLSDIRYKKDKSKNDIRITVQSREIINNIRKDNKIMTQSEIIWRVMNNGENRKV
jgi:predicted CopG family antitoxin